MKINIPMVGAVIAAFTSSLCCLPAFLFIFFGISSSFLSFFSTIDYIRWPASFIAILFLSYGIKKSYKKISCECSKDNKVKKIILMILLSIFVILLLIYPEFLPFIMEIK